MTALESLLSAIDAMAAACDRGSTHWDGCEAEHPRCKVYRAAEAVKAELATPGCGWRYSATLGRYTADCGLMAFSLPLAANSATGATVCPYCNRQIVEVTDGD